MSMITAPPSSNHVLLPAAGRTGWVLSDRAPAVPSEWRRQTGPAGVGSYVGNCGHRRALSNPACGGPCLTCDTQIGTESSVPCRSTAIRETPQRVSSRTAAEHHLTPDWLPVSDVTGANGYVR